MDPKRWIGREIEYRSFGPLSRDPNVFRGRITKILVCGCAVVRVTHSTKLEIKSKDIIKKLVGIEYFKKRHHKTIYKPTGFKYPFESVNDSIDHIVKWNGSRWKQIHVTESFKYDLEYYTVRYLDRLKK